MHRISKLLFLPALLLVTSISAHAAGVLGTPVSKPLLVVSQAVATDGTASISAYVSPLLFAGAGQGTDIGGTKIRNPSAVGSMPVFTPSPAGATLTQAQLLAQTKAYFSGYADLLGSSLSNYMKANGLSQAWFFYSQHIDVAVPVSAINPTGRKEKVIAWSYFVDQDGRAVYGDPRVIDTDPVIVYAMYTPAAVASGLPSGWSYGDAGTIQWQLRDLNFKPLTALATINVGGAFDAPETGNPDAGLACLASNSNPGCNPALVDLRGIINQQGAAFGVLDYVRAVQPVYDQQPDGTLKARSSVSVDYRELTYRLCGGAAYRNEGHYGFELNLTVDRYLVQPDGAYNPLQEFNSAYASPTQTYDWTMTVSRNVALNQINSLIIRPTDGATLVNVSNVQNLVYLAPIVANGDTRLKLFHHDVNTCASDTSQTNCSAYADVSCRMDGQDGFVFTQYSYETEATSPGIGFGPNVDGSVVWGGPTPNGFRTNCYNGVGGSAGYINRFFLSQGQPRTGSLYVSMCRANVSGLYALTWHYDGGSTIQVYTAPTPYYDRDYNIAWDMPPGFYHGASWSKFFHASPPSSYLSCPAGGAVQSVIVCVPNPEDDHAALDIGRMFAKAFKSISDVFIQPAYAAGGIGDRCYTNPWLEDQGDAPDGTLQSRQLCVNGSNVSIPDVQHVYSITW